MSVIGPTLERMSDQPKVSQYKEDSLRAHVFPATGSIYAKARKPLDKEGGFLWMTMKVSLNLVIL